MSHDLRLIRTSLFIMLLAGCGARLEPTDTSTSWLATCGSSAECSDSLVCLCGVCTLACEEDAQCGSASASAVCRAPDDECSQAASLCLTPSGEPDDISTQADTGDAGNSDVTDVEDTSDVRDGDGTEIAPSTSEPIPSSTNAPDAGPSEPPAEICDGSDDVRFVYLHDTSGQIAEQNFVAAHGWRMLTIDGKCNFWTTNGAGTLREGAFEPEDLEDLRQSHYGKLGTYPKEELEDCADSSQRVLWDPYGSAVCWCDCDSDAQPGRKAAFEFAQALFDTALPETTASEGDLQMLVLNQSWDPAYPLVEWPLTFDPRQVAEEPEAVLWTRDSGTLVVAGPDAELLRAATTYNPSYFRYVDATADAGTEVELLVYLRDEPPAKVLAALEAARDENRPGQ